MLASGENFKIWQDNIAKALFTLGESISMRKSFLGEDDHYSNSFSELIMHLYDDLDFNRFIEAFKEIDGNEEILDSMKEFNIKVISFEERAYGLESSKEGIEIILRSPEWVEICKKAEWLSNQLKSR